MSASAKHDGKLRVALIGATGYAGFEAIVRLLRHPEVQITGLYGPEDELGPIDAFYPLLTGQLALAQERYDPGRIAETADLALLCVPHKVAMSYVPALRDAGLRVIDWSADYRIKDRACYERWYCPHTDADRLDEAAYGLCEFFRDEIASADLVANPGCYPTCASLALGPLLADGLIEPDDIVVNAISGVSGAGRTPGRKTHFPDRNENFEPYGVGVHRHMPEMEQCLSTVAGRPVSVMFVPHLCPMDRGMLCSIYARPARDGLTAETLTDALRARYAGAAFVRVRDEVLPATKYVAHTNFCDIAVRVGGGRVMLFSALDNLVKGASGQAIQNMNLMYGFEETLGLL